MTAEELLQAALTITPELKPREKSDRAAIAVPREHVVEVMRALRNDPRFDFDMLMDCAAVDWPATQEIEVLYQLYSSAHQHYLMVGVRVPRSRPELSSLHSFWQIAEWQEREIYDLFGVRFENHPDLRRILLEDDWAGYPLLKDYKDDFMLERPW